MGNIMELRKLVGTRPIIMVGVSIIVRNSEGQILLMKRTDSLDWGTLGGSMELGETFEEIDLRYFSLDESIHNLNSTVI